MHWRSPIRSTITHTILSPASLPVKCPVLPGLLAFLEQAAQDLTRWYPWHHLDEFYSMQPFIVCQFSIRKGQQFLGSNVVSWTDNDKAFRHFTCFIVRNADDSGVLDGGMLHKQGLQFGGGNAKTLILDHIFLAVNDVDVAFLVHVSDIASEKPAVTHGACSFFRRLPVALHNMWAADDNLSIFTGC